MEDNKNNILLTVLGVCTLLVAVVGASFAFFSAQSTAPVQNVKTGKLQITSSLSKPEEAEYSIKPTNFAAATAKDNDDVAKLTFTVDGTGTTVDDATYSIHLTGTATLGAGGEGAGGAVKDVEYALFKGDSNSISGDPVASGDFSQISGDTVIKTDLPLSASSETYTLCVYIKETSSNQDKLQSRSITATMWATAQTPSPAA